MPTLSKFRTFLSKPVSRIESILITVVLVPLLASAVASAATTISTDISTGGVLTVSGAGNSSFVGKVGMGSTSPTTALSVEGTTTIHGNLSVSGTTNGVKVYRALLTQEGTAAPTVTIIENTVGAVVWTRSEAGLFFGTLSGAFPQNKTHALVTGFSGNDPTTGFQTLDLHRGSDNNVELVVIRWDTDGAWNGGALADGLSELAIQILVYP